MFTFITTNGLANTFQWQVNLGGGFVNVTPNATNVISTSGDINTTTLSVINPGAALNGATYRVFSTSLSFGTAPALLTINQPGVVYVKTGATGANNGTSWQNAFTSLASAVNVANACENIWVAAGTYPTSGAILFLNNGATIYGGFAGTETNLSQRN